MLQPDAVRGIALDMSQYGRLFAACRVPTDVGLNYHACIDRQRGCRMQVDEDSRHIVVLRRGQFCKYNSNYND